MKSPAGRAVLLWPCSAVLLALIPVALGHGDEPEGMDAGMGAMGMTADSPQAGDGSYPPTYFAHPEHRGAVYGHIALMVASWVFMLPVGESPRRTPKREITRRLTGLPSLKP